MVQQFDNARAIGDGGGLFVLENPFRGELRIRNLAADSVCRGGSLNGKKLADGHFLSPELSYDGTKALFAWNSEKPLATNYAIFQVNVDGSNLGQLTDGSANDFDPCFLPNGRIAFVSTRRGGVGRAIMPRGRAALPPGEGAGGQQGGEAELGVDVQEVGAKTKKALASGASYGVNSM